MKKFFLLVVYMVFVLGLVSCGKQGKIKRVETPLRNNPESHTVSKKENDKGEMCLGNNCLNLSVIKKKGISEMVAEDIKKEADTSVLETDCLRNHCQ